MTYGPVQTRSGAILQSGVPKTRQRIKAGKANGLLLRGVVVVTYVIDDAAHPEANFDSRVAVYCDCMVLTNIPGSRWLFLPRVLVSQDRGGIHEDNVWKPRATSMDITGVAVDGNKATNPANLDGDHVLIGFMNDDLSEPVILKGLPHPVADTGQENEAAGHRLRLKVADGDPSFRKHRGAFYGISKDGDFVADLTQAYATDLGADGKQPTPPDDGTTGNFLFKAQTNGEVVAEVDGGKKLYVKSGELALGVESPADWVALAALVKTEIQKVITSFNAHIHITTATVGPSAVAGVITPPTVPATAAADVKSATVKSE